MEAPKQINNGSVLPKGNFEGNSTYQAHYEGKYILAD
jgi:hypothetical protein